MGDLAQFAIVILQLGIAVLQVRLSVEQNKIALEQKRLAEAQGHVDLLTFVDRYVNGYVYLYGMVPAQNVARSVRELRSLQLPAIAAPSQFHPDLWVINSPSFGAFASQRDAQAAYDNWVRNKTAWDLPPYRRKALIDRWAQHRQSLGYTSSPVYYYKADIITHRRYFEALARSTDFLVEP